MDVRSCRRCNKLFQYYGNPLCSGCVQELDRQFSAVKNYLYDNPDASMETVVEDTGVSEEEILRWLKEGRLVVSDHGVPLLRCETCDKPIRSGRFCGECSENLRRTLEGTARTLSERREPNKTARRADDDKGMYIKH